MTRPATVSALLLLLLSGPAAAARVVDLERGKARLQELRDELARELRAGRARTFQAKMQAACGKRGDAQACMMLAALQHRDGKVSLAIETFERAFGLGEPTGAEGIAQIFDDGAGVPKDPERAWLWYFIAHESGLATQRVNTRLGVLAGSLSEDALRRLRLEAKARGFVKDREPPPGYRSAGMSTQ